MLQVGVDEYMEYMQEFKQLNIAEYSVADGYKNYKIYLRDIRQKKEILY